MEAVLGFLAVLAIVALLFFCLSMLARRAYMRRQRSLELHAPLLKCVTTFSLESVGAFVVVERRLTL